MAYPICETHLNQLLRFGRKNPDGFCDCEHEAGDCEQLDDGDVDEIIKALTFYRSNAAKVIESAKEVRLNIASMTPEMQKIIDHNGWMTVLRNRLDNRPDDARVV